MPNIQSLLADSGYIVIDGAMGTVLFAAGLEGVADAGELVAAGVYRLCVEAARLDGANVQESVATYSRLLGRSI